MKKTNNKLSFFFISLLAVGSVLIAIQPSYVAASSNVFTKLKAKTLNVTKSIKNKKGDLTIKDVLSVTKQAIFGSDVSVQGDLSVDGATTLTGSVGVINIDFTDSDTSLIDTSTLTAGSVYYNSADLNLYMWDGSAWVDLTAQDTDTDTNTTYTAGTGLTLTDTVFAASLGTTIESSEITDSTISSADVAADTLSADDIATSGVATAEILDGTVSADDIANVTRTISIPLYSFYDCQTNAGAAIPFTDGVDTLANFINSPTDGMGMIINFDDTSGTEDQSSEVCSNFTIPLDYASGGEFRIRALKDAHAGASEIISMGVALNGGSLGTAGTATTTSLDSTSYKVTPTATYVASDSVNFYISITSGTTMDDQVGISGVEFVYTATQ